MPRIYITEPNHFYTYELPIAPGAEVLIGTAPQCQLALPGVGGLGEMHARIICRPEGYVIADLGSPTGTFANGVPIQSEYLMAGVEYRMGAAVITLAAEGAAQAPPQQAAAPQPAPEQAAPAAQAAAAAPQKKPATAAKPSLKKKSAPLKKSGSSTKLGKTDINSMAAKFDRSRGKTSSQAKFIYVVVLLVVAFYAGIALHHWERSGNFLPGIVADEQDPPAPVAEPAKPVAAESDEDTTTETGDSAADDTPADDTPAVDDTPADDTPAEDTTPAEDDTTADDDTPAADEDTTADDDTTESNDDEPTADEEPEEATEEPESDDSSDAE